jgi:hypothetical protein
MTSRRFSSTSSRSAPCVCAPGQPGTYPTYKPLSASRSTTKWYVFMLNLTAGNDLARILAPWPRPRNEGGCIRAGWRNARPELGGSPQHLPGCSTALQATIASDCKVVESACAGLVGADASSTSIDGGPVFVRQFVREPAAARRAGTRRPRRPLRVPALLGPRQGRAERGRVAGAVCEEQVGGSTWNSSVNRRQVTDGALILGDVVPIVIHLMMENPGQLWGDPCYPVVDLA